MKKENIGNYSKKEIQVEKTKSKKHIKLKRFFIAVFAMIFLVGAYALTVNFYVILSQDEKFISESDVKNIDDVDCVLVLGCRVWGDTPSPMLEDRLNGGIAVFNDLSETKLLLSGDNSSSEYNEVGVMEKYSESMGIEKERIIPDDYGYSTYESVYNAKNKFGAKKMIIVTQSYHLSRALFIAEKMGVEAYGVSAVPTKYQGQVYRSLREIAARNKDFLKCML